jgi:hypothetical protein
MKRRNLIQGDVMKKEKKKDEVIRKCDVCQAYHRGECPPERLVFKDKYDTGIDGSA